MKLNEIHIRDPFILPYDGRYFLYGSRGDTCWTDGRKADCGFDVYVSNDLTDWSEPQEIFGRSPSFWADRNFWAPEVHRYGGAFYMFATFTDGKRWRGTQILRCDSPDGRFEPVTKLPVTPDRWPCLDGTLYIDRAGTPHLVFCHEWVQCTDGEICEFALRRDLTAPLYEPRLLLKASQACWARKGADNYVTDGPFMYRGKSGKLYMLWSGFTDDGYVEAVSVSDNGEIDGRWSDLPLLAGNDGGHGMIFEGFDGRQYLILHRPNRSPSERPEICEIVETADGLCMVQN